MTERRPHWEDELIEAVTFAAYNELMPSDELPSTLPWVFDIIAAVEDKIGERAERLQAVADVLRDSNRRMHRQIQAVREARDD